jgi:hypothetical protein
MKEKKARPGIARKRHRVNVPLYALKTSDAVKVLSDSPRRLVELWELFADGDRAVRQRAASALAQLASLRPAALVRSGHRIRELLEDESAYVRWHGAYTVGRVIGADRARIKRWIPDLAAAMEDPNSVVRAMAVRALTRVAASDFQILREAFQGMNREIPPILAETLQRRNREACRQGADRREEDSV